MLNLKTKIRGSILWFVVVIFIAVWLLGFLGIIAGMATGNLIHILFVITVTSILYNLITGKKPCKHI
ncbi:MULTISPECIES: lmo0937 family membrane protein [unclassified Polaribacter]|uniref:lmo0937 family membrane protein n=1 Tax=unclassified Polaribacter TaxID=196858 RepID=UPI0011BD453F|nr:MULTISPECIES: lmo0937 family membrane protein [unclassified Polaribacter]TXD52571.1 lmo0937 family membrane protein [Polaribacter sp. IC063]TXD56780.1 lmo0937 family membrane protein [Polaribacter sp. IC066]